jgi:hypothetical protein
MDIHKPKHPIHGVGAFLFEMFTVTCGIVIALSLEGLVVNWRDARLVRQTRQDFAAEIADNLQKTQTVHDEAAGDEAWMRAALAYAAARLKNDNSKTLPNLAPRRFAVLRNSAWETALATQAIRLLRFDEARALAAAYNDQAAFNDISARARDQWIGISVADNVAELSDVEIRAAMGLLHVSIAYTASMAVLEARLMDEYKAAQKAISK